MAAAPVPRISQVRLPGLLCPLVYDDLPKLPWRQEELLAFGRSHFSAEAVEDFGRTFTQGPAGCPSLGRQGGEHDDDDGDDELGYYDDGVKRTLTDEQIEIFRQSELREMRRQGEQQEAEGAAGRRDGGEVLGDDSAPRCSADEALAEERTGKPRKDTKRRKKAFPKRGPRGEPKPDLRKRTWDVVEAGVDRLEYD